MSYYYLLNVVLFVTELFSIDVNQKCSFLRKKLLIFQPGVLSK